MNSVEYGNLDTVDKRAVVLDYFFKKYNENNEFTDVKPKDVKNEYKLTSNQHRTLNRNFEWLLLKYLIKGETEKVDSDKVYNTSFRLDSEKFKFNIPADSNKRLHYSKLLSALLSSSEALAENISYFRETAAMGMQLITKLTDGAVRDVLLASKIYEYYKCNSGNLLHIVAELSHYNQPIEIEFSDGRKIKNGIIKSIGIYEDGVIELCINRDTVVIDSVDEISNIFVLSKHYPSSPKTGFPSMTTTALLDSLKTQKNYTKMVEIYLENCISKDVENDSLEKYIERLSKRTENCLNLCERANRRIKIID